MTNETDTSAGPLADIAVLDCTQMLSGPFATQLLVELGADVVKIERPGHGDITRAVGPEVGETGLSAYFVAMNRGKRSVELDLSTEEGAASFLRLVEAADVVMENYRPGTMEKWGLDFETLKRHNEDIIYCSISGFLDGPYRDLAAFDMVVQALSGSMSVTGPADGPPARPGIPIGDISSGMYAVIATVIALYNREDRGAQHIEVPMFEGLVSWLVERAGRTFVLDEPYPRLGTVHPSLAPYRAFPSEDGWFACAIASQTTWRTFCEAIDRADLLEDSRFETNRSRVEHRDALAAELEPIFARRSTEEWFDLFREYGIPGAPIKNTLEVFEDEHLRASDRLSDLELDGVEMPFALCPIDFKDGFTPRDGEPPSLGEHTGAVLDWGTHQDGTTDRNDS